MATTPATATAPVSEERRLGVLRLAVTGALSAAIFFALCWAGAVLGLRGLDHMYIELYTGAEVASALALFEGLFWSLTAGLLVGAIVASVYNALARLGRR